MTIVIDQDLINRFAIGCVVLLALFGLFMLILWAWTK